MKTYIYPGSFDPITNGHLDIIDRASELCDNLIVAVLENAGKKPVFTVDERMGMIKSALEGRRKVSVESFSGLLVEFMKLKKADVIVKGLRAVSDFDYELQMALLNKSQSPEIETLFLIGNLNYLFLSSSAVRDLASHGGKIDDLVPKCIVNNIYQKLNK